MKRQPPPLTLKTSTILIGKGNRKLVFGSRSDLPADLRADLETALSGKESFRLLIADRRGRDRLIRAISDGVPARRITNRTRRRFLRVEIALVVLLCTLLGVIAVWK